jgi:hypothetical protein
MTFILRHDPEDCKRYSLGLRSLDSNDQLDDWIEQAIGLIETPLAKSRTALPKLTM